MGAYDRALPLYERALEIREKALGPTHPETAACMNNLAGLHRLMGADAQALPLFERALTIREQVLGPDHPDTAASMNNLAGLYKLMGAYDKALPLYARTLAITEKALGHDHHDTATRMNNLADTYESMGAYDRALPLYERALAIRERALGPEDVGTAASLNNLAFLHEQMGAYAQALPMYERALRIHEKVLGPEHPATATSLNNVAGLLESMGAYEQAIPLYQRALGIKEKVFGPEDPNTATSLNNLASLYRAMGAYDRALPLLQRALAISEKALGPEHPDTAMSVNNLASMYASVGAYNQALPLAEHALSILEKVLGPAHPNTAASLNGLASLYGSMGAYDRALPACERALAIREKTLGPDHPLTATSVNNLASLYHAIGAYDRALPLYARALAAKEKALGPGHPETATDVNNLAGLFESMGAHDRALPLYERALALREKALGPQHPDTARSLNNLAALYALMGWYDRALPLHERALVIREKALGPEHPDTAGSLSSIAGLYESMGGYDRALPLYERALAIREKALGPQHPRTGASLYDLAINFEASRFFDRASPLIDRALSVEEDHIARTLLIGSRRDQLAFLATTRDTTDVTLSLNLHDLPNDRPAANRALLTLLRRKSRATETAALVMTETRRNLGPEGQAQLGELRLAVREREALGRRGPGPEGIDAWKARLADADTRIDSLESALSQQSAAFRRATTPIEIEDIRAKLPPNSALVEFAIWHPFDPHGTVRRSPPRYAIYVLSADGSLTWSDLGPADAVDTKVNALRDALTRGAAWRGASTALYAAILGPIEHALTDTTRLYLSPDGALSLIPFGLLRDKDGKPIDSGRTLVLLGAGREILNHGSIEPGTTPVVISGVDYGPPGPWATLPGTTKEGRSIRKSLQASSITGRSATETALSTLHGPTVLHIATHGFFDRDTAIALLEAQILKAAARNSRSTTLSPPDDPDTALWRSGLVLAGANNSSEEADNGYFTAAEVASLDLHGTRLVVLSACETGVGTPRAGEGVMGLRHALVVAGSDAQLLTLWKVDDEATAAFMKVFYGELKENHTVAEALSTAQTSVASEPRWAKPYYWAGFTLSGDPDVRLGER